MGVHGLWRLLDPAGKPVSLESLRGRTLAVDISIWLHRMVKGFRDAKGGSVPNAHLLGLFQRLCKLLYYGIRPIFVFDGAFPALKRQTIINRQNKRTQMKSDSDRLRRQLMEIVAKHSALRNLPAVAAKKSPTKRPAPSEDDDLFKLPPRPLLDDEEKSSSESDSEQSATKSQPRFDLHTIDPQSNEFKKLPARERHDILTDLKETRKDSSWGRLHQLPKKLDNFSDYQMERLLKRRRVQVSLEETEKEIGGHSLTLNDLEILLNEEGIETKIDSVPTRRIASNEQSSYVLVKDIKGAYDRAKEFEKSRKISELPSTSSSVDEKEIDKLGGEYDKEMAAAIQLSLEGPNKCEELETSNDSDAVEKNIEQDHELAAAIQLSLEDPKKTDKPKKIIELNSSSNSNADSDIAYKTELATAIHSSLQNEDSNSKNKNGGTKRVSDMSSARAYMMEFSGLTEYEINNILKDEAPHPTTSSTNILKNMEKNVAESSTPYNIDTSDDDVIEIVENSKSKSNEILNINSQAKSSSNILKDAEKNVPESSKPYNVDASDDDVIEIVENIKSNSNEISQAKSEKELNNKTPVAVTHSDSESDGSFEEVPDICSDKDVPLNSDISDNFIHENDMFADVFDDVTKLKLLDDLLVEKFNSLKDKHKTSLNSEIENILQSMGVEIGGENWDAIKDEVIQEVHMQLGNLSKEDSVAEEIFPTPVVCQETGEEASSEINSISKESDLNSSNIENEVIENITIDDNAQEEQIVIDKPETEKTQMTEEEALELAMNLDNEKSLLQQEQNRLDRMGRNVSEEMTQEAQELLKLFGIPYIIAPTEAEAQCAFLETAKLTDGTITDDSDIWLFGGRTVYRDFFNQQKHVLQFLAENIERSFKLKREDFVLLALLVGSDYTLGVSGVGPVTALEILAAFPPIKTEIVPPYAKLLEGLKKFKSWVSSGHSGTHVRLKNKLKNVGVSEEFPNHKIVEAYLIPDVEQSKESFSWGKPDVSSLLCYAREKFGWSRDKTEEVLVPVIKKMAVRVSQTSIHSFFNAEFRVDVATEKMSKRVKRAIDDIGSESASSATSESRKEAIEVPKPAKNKPPPRKRTKKSDLKVNAEVENAEVKAIAHDAPPRLTSSDAIPQREADKMNMLKNKLKAIEEFRKSRKGPGYVPRKKRVVRQPKEDAGLSESDSD